MAETRSHDKPVKRTRKMQALGASINKLTRKTFAGRGLADGAIIQKWPAIIGDMLANVSQPEKIAYSKGRRGRGTLHLRVANSAMATEIQHLTPVLLERINAYFGYEAVANLKLIHGPLPRRPGVRRERIKSLSSEETRQLRDDIVNVEDPELRAALESLGQAVLGRRKLRK